MLSVALITVDRGDIILETMDSRIALTAIGLKYVVLWGLD